MNVAVVTAQHTFKPFLVEANRKTPTIFRVVEMSEENSREQVEQLLERLPITFNIQKTLGHIDESLKEPLEVYVDINIIYIYPPKNRVITCTSFDSHRIFDYMKGIDIDNVMDSTFPGPGQLRTCIHFSPRVLGIENWQRVSINGDIEVDIHMFPKGQEHAPTTPTAQFTTIQLRQLLETIAGGSKELTPEQFALHKDIIMHVVNNVRFFFDTKCEATETKQYYQSCWNNLDSAQNDIDIIDALEELRFAIEYK